MKQTNQFRSYAYCVPSVAPELGGVWGGEGGAAWVELSGSALFGVMDRWLSTMNVVSSVARPLSM